MEDKRKILYNQLSKDYDLGDFDSFSAKLDDETKRKAFYDAVSKDYDLGDYNSFVTKISASPQPETVEVANKPSESVDTSANEKPNSYGDAAQTTNVNWSNPTHDWKTDNQKAIEEIARSGNATIAKDEQGNEYYPVKPMEVAFDEGLQQEKKRIQALATVGEQLDNRIKANEEALKEAYDKRESSMNRGNSFVFGAGASSAPKVNTDAYDETIKNLIAEQDYLTNSKKLYEAAKNDAGFFSGMKDAVDASFLTFGVSDLHNAERISNVQRKLESGQPLSESEQSLLTSLGLQQVVNEQYNELLGRWYKAGMTTADMVPFMAEMAVNPLSGLGKSAMKASVKKFGEKGVKAVTTKILSRAIGDAAGAAGMAVTTGMPSVMADALERQQGYVTTDTSSGVVEGVGLDGGESASDAWRKAITSRTIENWSEMVGNYFAPIGKTAGKITTKTLNALKLGKVNEIIDNINSSNLARILDDFTEQTQWNGSLGEFAEEQVGMIADALLVGDTKWSDITDLDQQLDVALGVGVFGSFMSLLRIGGYRTPKYRARKAVERADKDGLNVFGSEWEGIKELILASPDEELSANLAAHTEFSTEQMKAALMYANALKAQQAVNTYKEKEKIDKPSDVGVETEFAYDEGFETTENYLKHYAKRELDFAESELGVTSENSDEQQFAQMVMAGADSPVESINAMAEKGYSDEQIQKAKDYYTAYHRMNGITDALLEDVDSQIERANNEVDANTNQDNGSVTRVVLRNGGVGHVVEGTVVRAEDGTVDVNNSDDVIFVRLENGETKMMNPNKDLVGVAWMNSPERLKEYNNTILKQYLLDKAIGEIDWNPATPNPKVGDSFEMNGVPVIVAAITENGLIVVPAEEWQKAQGNYNKMKQIVAKAQQTQPIPFKVYKDWASAQLDAQEQTANAQQTDANNLQTELQTEANMPESPTSSVADGNMIPENRPMSEEEADTFIFQMERNAVEAPEIELTPENWIAEFGEDGLVETPIGQVKFGHNQYVKLQQMGRNGKLGMVKPTLTNPDIVIEDKRPSKSGSEEREFAYVFVKAFTGKDGKRMYYFTSVTVKKGGSEVVISNQEKSVNKISRLLQSGNVVWTNSLFSSHPTTRIEESVPLNDSNKPTSTDSQSAWLGINSSELSENKDKSNNVQSQENQGDFVSMGKEKAFEVLGNKYGEKMPRKVEVTAKALAEDLRKAQQKLDKAELDYDDAPIGREDKAEKALNKAREEFEAVKREADFWAEMDTDVKKAKAERELILNPTVEVDLSNEPMTADEFIAQQLASGNITLIKDEFMRETGFGDEEANNINGGSMKIFQTKEQGGISIEAAGERLMEMDREEGTNFFDQSDANAGRDALISFLGSVGSRKEINDYIKNRRADHAKKESEALRDRIENDIWNNYHMTAEEYATLQEMGAIENPFEGVDIEAKDAIFAEAALEYEEYLKSLENGQGTTEEVIEGNSDVLSEEQSNNTGGTEQRQGERLDVIEGTLQQNEEARAGEVGKNEKVGRKRPKGFGKPKKSTEELFSEEKDKFSNTVNNDYAEVLSKSNSVDEAITEFKRRAEEARKRANEWRNRKYKENKTVVTGMNPYSGADLYETTIGAANERRREANVRNALDEAEKYESYASTLAERTNYIQVKGLQQRQGERLDVSVQSDDVSQESSSGNEVVSQIEQARAEVDANPTEAQKEAGNYKKGHVKIDGYDITIENPKGGVRSGTDKNGKKWSITMNNDYGYIRGTEAVDGDHIDVFLSDNPTEGNVFVVDQSNEDGSFDESKVMYGFSSLEEARAAYLSNYEKGWESRIMAITEVSKDEFKKWIDSSHRKTKAFGEYKSVKAEAGQGYSIEASNVSRMEDIEARITEIENERIEIEGELENLGNSNPLASVELISQLDQLDREQSELEAEYSGLRSMNDESNAILEEEGSNLRFREQQAKEEKRRKPLRERAKEWSKKLGVKVKVMESLKDVTNASARRAIIMGETVTGWYEESTGEVCLYMPYLSSESEVDATYIHEVVAHKGLRGLLGDKFDEFCDQVWEMMSAADKAKFIRYPGVNGNTRAAADEYIAHLAETIDVADSSWSKFTELIKKFLKAIGLEPKMTNADIANAIKRSYQRLADSGNVENVGGEVTRFRTLEEINQAFNEELQQQIDGTLPNGHIYQLGSPSAVLLSTGIADVPIELNSTRLEDKSKNFGHDYDLSELKDLVKAIHNPMAIFTYGDKNKAQNIIVEIQHEGKNFIVGLSIRPSVGGRVLDINSIRNVFPKDNAEWLNWISQGKMLYADKERIQNLINQQRTNLADVDYLDLDSIANIINSFENPILPEEKTLFRTVYHGSAASFDKFDHSFMSTGEGNQSYGWGTYLTDVESIGKQYANMYAKNSPLAANALRWIEENGTYDDFLAKGEGKRRNWAIRHAKDYLKELKKDGASEDVIKAYEQDLVDAENALSEESYNRTKENMIASLNRNLYTVDIPDNDGTNYLEWDKPLSEENKKRIKDAVLNSQMYKDYAAKYGEDVSLERLNSWLNAFDAGRVYRLLENFADKEDGTESAKQISMLLSDAGYIGFEYPSNFMSGGNENGSKNYVIFNEHDLDIVEHTRFRAVTDKKLIDKLESEPKIKVYRAMQVVNGKLYPPMSAKVDGKLREPIELGKWEEAEERPDLADSKGYFKLDKGNKTSLKARYNPYIHTSTTPLNDQFSSAQDRPELVTVEVEIPKSELTSGYKAEKAKDAVGKLEWKAGVVQGKLSGTRTVILSRWDKPIRIVPDSEVADEIVKMFGDKKITMPSNVVTPSLRSELEKRGVPFVETDNRGREVGVRFRVSPKMDAEYIEAVNSGDMEKAQKMVGEAAKLAMPNTKVVDENGDPLVVYHGTGKKFYTFKSSNKRFYGSPDAYFFTDDKVIGEDYSNGYLIPAFLNIENPKTVDFKGSSWSGEIFENGKHVGSLGSSDSHVKKAHEEGYDGVILKNIKDAISGELADRIATDYVAFESNQIKSADPVTYDDNGNVIPLSERFNSESIDIRFRTAYHGSAAEFDKFNKDFIGSGEGQAVMGHGFYFTTSEGTSEYYANVASENKRKIVQEGGYTFNGEVVRDRALVSAYELLKDNNFDADKAIERANHRIEIFKKRKGIFANTSTTEKAIEYLEAEKNNPGSIGYQEEIVEKPSRVKYEVEIPDDTGKNYLDLDKKATKKFKDESKKRMIEVLDNGEEASYWKKNRDIINYEWESVDKNDATNDTVRGTMEQFISQEEVANIFSEMGYVGSKAKASDGTTYIIYNEDDIEIKGSTRFRIANQNQEIFVSNAQKAVEGIKQEKATPGQWLAMIEKNGGMKAGEDKWLGLSDWLKASDKKSLTKAEILDFIGENKIRIEEVHYGDANTNPSFESLKQEYDQWLREEGSDYAWNELIERFGDDAEIAFSDMGGELVVENEDAAATLLGGDNIINYTRLNYTTEGLENKHEIALTVPTIESWNEDDEIHFGDAGGGRAVAWIRFGETFMMEDDSYIRKVTELKEPYRDVNGHDIYKTDSGSQNDFIVHGKGRNGEMIYVAYVNGNQIPVPHKTLEDAMGEMNKYFKEHPIKDRKRRNVLVIDEIQSKRHQEGREKGYRSKDYDQVIKKLYHRMVDTQIEWKSLYNSLCLKYSVDSVNNGKMSIEDNKRFAEVTDSRDAAYKEYHEARNKKLVPEAPFEKNWSELAIKRMLRYAAENGYDKVAWTKGAQQAERYDMSKSIDSILCEDETISEFADGTPIAKAFVLTTSGGMDIRINADKDGMIRGGEYAGHNISDVVGKELAGKMMQPGNFTISGEGLHIGGEGMKGFYDKMLPSFVSKYVKKWGTKVQDIELPNVEEAGRIMHSVDVTDAMKESVMEGQTMFRVTKAQPKNEVEVESDEDLQRKGEGPLTADEVSLANDPLGKVLGQPTRTAGQRKSFAQRERQRMVERVTSLAKKLGLKNVEIVTDASTLSGAQRKAKGFYSKSKRKITIVIPNHSSVFDAEQTLLHEAVGHYGLRELFGNHFDTFLNNVYKNASSEVRERINRLAMKNGWDFQKATEEYLASLAEDTNFEDMQESWWSKIKEYFLQMLHEIGFIGFRGVTLTDNELRYILWRSYENLAEPGRYRSILGEAADIAMQDKLKVGNYSQSKYERERLRLLASGLTNSSVAESAVPYTHKEQIEDLVEEFTSLYNSVPVHILDKNVSDKQLQEWTGMEDITTEELIDWMEEQKVPALHVRTNDNIIIFADKIKPEKVEETLFHENLHSLLNNGAHKELVDKFYKSAKDDARFGKWKKMADKEQYDDYERPEEFFVYVVSSGQVSGNLEDVFEYLTSGEQSELKNLLNINGYDYDNRRRLVRQGTSSVRGTKKEAHILGNTQGTGQGKGTEGLRSVSNSDEQRRGKKEELLRKDRDGNSGDKQGRTEPNKESKIRSREESGTNEAGQEGVEDDNLYRGYDEVEGMSDDTARWLYEKSVKGNAYRFQEGFQDAMLSLKKLQEAIVKQVGGKLEEWEDAYTAENQMSSRDTSEIENFMFNHFKPMMDAVAKFLRRSGLTYEDLRTYLFAKSGLERNRDFAVRDAIAQREKDGDDVTGIYEAYLQRKQELLQDLKDVTITFREYCEEMDNEAMMIAPDLMGRDYSGLSSLFGEDTFTEDAISEVEQVENLANTDALWNAIKGATQFSLDRAKQSGVMSTDVHKKLSEMFEWYIPMRGWSETKARDVYDYFGRQEGVFNPTIKNAYGRKSLADDPLATIANMAESSIFQGNKNQVKQKLLNLAFDKPTNLITVMDSWIENKGTEDDPRWEYVYPPIEQDDDADVIAAKIKQFEEEMEQKKDAGVAKKLRGNADIPYIATPKEIAEHIIRVKRNGREFVMIINGNPRAAQAINGETNPETYNGIIEQVSRRLNRFMAAAFTTKNPTFIMRNLSRDLIFSNTAVAIKESNAYGKKFRSNQMKVLGNMRGLMKRYQSGKLDMNNPLDKMFQEFIQNGGETGFAQLTSVDEYKKKIQRELKDARNRGKKISGKKVGRAVMDTIEFYNRCAEDVSRFTVYMTSRQMGRSIQRSVSDAKEITVNFNKRGSGSKAGGFIGFGAQSMRSLYLFFNAAVQALVNFKRLGQKHPIAFTTALSMYAVSGFLMPVVNEFLSSILGGDDDDYENLPEWVRRNNLVISLGKWGGDAMFLTVPLPIEMRAFYGLGETSNQLLAGNVRGKDAAIQIAGQFAEMLPLNFVTDAAGPFNAFTPDAFKPIAQAYVANKDWTGKPIYRDNGFNKELPEWTKAYAGTSKWLVNSAELLNELTGGDKYKSGVVDINPARLEHLFTGYSGGFGDMFLGGYKTISMLWDEDYRNVRNTPVLKAFLNQSDERTSYYQVKKDYASFKDEYEDTVRRLNGYERELKQPETALEYAERMDFLQRSPQIKRYEVMKTYEKELNKLYKEMKEFPDPEVQKAITTTINQIKSDAVTILREIK